MAGSPFKAYWYFLAYFCVFCRSHCLTNLYIIIKSFVNKYWLLVSLNPAYLLCFYDIKPYTFRTWIGNCHIGSYIPTEFGHTCDWGIEAWRLRICVALFTVRKQLLPIAFLSTQEGIQGNCVYRVCFSYPCTFQKVVCVDIIVNNISDLLASCVDQ